MSESRRHHHRGKSSEGRVDQARVLDALRIQPGQTILDAGCGNGYMSKAFARAVGATGRVFSLDPDEAAIGVLRGETVGTNIDAFVGDISKETGLPDSSVDIIYLSNVFHGFTQEELSGFRAEVDRLLRPGGTLAVVEIVKEATPFGPPMEIRRSPEELCRLIPLTPRVSVRVGEFHYMQLFSSSPG